MFVVTTKVSKTKLAAAVTLLIAVVVLVAVLSAAMGGTGQEDDALNGETNEARVAWLSRNGWELNAEPAQTQSVRIPTEDSELFTRYNTLQQSQGFDLRQYAGRQVTRYVYEVLNLPDAKGPVYATIFVLDGRIIGGDVTDSSPEGTMQALVRTKNEEGKTKN